RNHLHSKLMGLLELMPVYGADADLHQPSNQLLFHDTREGTGMGEAPAQIVVKVRVGIEVHNGEVSKPPTEAAQDRVSDGMIAAQHDERPPAIEQRRNRLFYCGKGLLGWLGETEVTRVTECSELAQVHAVLGPEIRRVAIE